MKSLNENWTWLGLVSWLGYGDLTQVGAIIHHALLRHWCYLGPDFVDGLKPMTRKNCCKRSERVRHLQAINKEMYSPSNLVQTVSYYESEPFKTYKLSTIMIQSSFCQLLQNTLAVDFLGEYFITWLNNRGCHLGHVTHFRSSWPSFMSCAAKVPFLTSLSWSWSSCSFASLGWAQKWALETCWWVAGQSCGSDCNFMGQWAVSGKGCGWFQ